MKLPLWSWKGRLLPFNCANDSVYVYIIYITVLLSTLHRGKLRFFPLDRVSIM